MADRFGLLEMRVVGSDFTWTCASTEDEGWGEMATRLAAEMKAQIRLSLESFAVSKQEGEGEAATRRRAAAAREQHLLALFPQLSLTRFTPAP